MDVRVNEKLQALRERFDRGAMSISELNTALGEVLRDEWKRSEPRDLSEPQ